MQPAKKYAYWRTDKPKEEGFSHELISCDFDNWKTASNTLDDLQTLPFEDVDTVIAALNRQVKMNPNKDMMGTKVKSGDSWKYEWLSCKQV